MPTKKLNTEGIQLHDLNHFLIGQSIPGYQMFCICVMIWIPDRKSGHDLNTGLEFNKSEKVLHMYANPVFGWSVARDKVF